MNEVSITNSKISLFLTASAAQSWKQKTTMKQNLRINSNNYSVLSAKLSIHKGFSKDIPNDHWNLEITSEGGNGIYYNGAASSIVINHPREVERQTIEIKDGFELSMQYFFIENKGNYIMDQIIFQFGEWDKENRQIALHLTAGNKHFSIDVDCYASFDGYYFYDYSEDQLKHVLQELQITNYHKDSKLQKNGIHSTKISPQDKF